MWQKAAWRIMPGLSLKYQTQEFTFKSTTEPQNPFEHNQSVGLITFAVDRAFNFNWGILLPRLMATYNYQLSQSEKYSSDQSSVAELIPLETHNANIDIGTTFVWANGLAGFINSRTLIASDQYRAQSWELGLRKEL